MVAATRSTTAKPPLVLIPGWGHTAAVWQELIPLVNTSFEIHLCELPGYGDAGAQHEEYVSVDEVVDVLAADLPRGSILCGWSLGGMLATRLARRYPERVKALLTLCSNPLFVARHDWKTAMPKATFHEFSRQLGNSPVDTIGRFRALASVGSRTAKQDLRLLRELASKSVPPAKALVASLRLLQELDTRDDLASITTRQLHILGAEDSLVPAVVAEAIKALNPKARVMVVPGVAHLPMLSCPEVLVEQIRLLAREDLARAG